MRGADTSSRADHSLRVDHSDHSSRADTVARSAGTTPTRAPRRTSLLVFLTAFLCIILFGFGIYYYLEHTVSYEYTVEWVRGSEGDPASPTQVQRNYASFDGGIIIYSRDGAEFVSSNNDDVWERSYEMSTPIADVTDSYVALADQGHSKLYIFNSAGLTGETDTLHPLSKIAVADNGIVYAVLNDTSADIITAYRPDGSNMDLTVRSVISGDGYPFDMDVSPDGTEVLTSYVSLENEQIVNNVVFRNFSSVGANEDSRRVVGGFRDEFEGHLAGRVHFSTDEYSQAFYDGGIVFFSTRVLNSPEVLANVSFDQDILSIDYNERLVAVLLSGESGQNTLRIYSPDGRLRGEAAVPSAAGDLCINGGRVILYGPDHIYAYGRSGDLLGDIAVSEGEIRTIIASGTNRSFYMVMSQGVIQRVTL